MCPIIIQETALLRINFFNPLPKIAFALGEHTFIKIPACLLTLPANVESGIVLCRNNAFLARFDHGFYNLPYFFFYVWFFHNVGFNV